MNSTNNTIVIKKIMATVGLFWFAYIVFHMLSLLNFHYSKTAFNSFYAWFNGTPFYVALVVSLTLGLLFHVVTAVSRQLNNNTSIGSKYHKAYPKAVPRVLAWGGACFLLAFIIFHAVQVTIFADKDLYNQMVLIFSAPLMWLIYILGLVTLGLHLHHGLTNVLQTFGLSSKQYNIIVIIILLIIMLGFLSIPISIVL